MDSGFSSGGTPFEYSAAVKITPAVILKRILLVTLYVLWTATFLLVGVFARIIAPLLAFIPISLWILIYFTWRLTQIEYEYSFFSGELSVSRIMGGKSRKLLVKVQIRSLASVFPYEDEFVRKAEQYQAQRSLFAASSLEAPDLYIILFQDESTGKRTLLCIELNEKALKIIRYYNSPALTVRKNNQ